MFTAAREHYRIDLYNNGNKGEQRMFLSVFGYEMFAEMGEYWRFGVKRDESDSVHIAIGKARVILGKTPKRKPRR
jgi:hypothetical protein